MALTGRMVEQQTLERFYTSKRAEFLALYGRRRVGKTFLIKQFFAKKQCVFFHVTGIKDGSLSEQISRFIKSISHTFYKDSDIKEQSNWFDAFDALTDAINKHAEKNKKIVIFLDEFPWMATHKSKLLQSLDHFWNHYWSNNVKIKLVICGSSASWIINKIINNKGGLHNRITKKMLLKPFTLQETKKFLSAQAINLNNWHVTQIYMTTGGIPFYLSFVEKGQSSAQTIESLAFTENAPLLKEFDNLFSSLFENEEPYIELLRIIAKHRYGIAQSDIAKQSSYFSKGGRITNKLKELKETGFILGFKPHQHKKKGVYYRVIDEYTLFYFYWIEPIRGTLQEESLEKGYWQALQTSAAWHSWSGYSFEAIVYKHLSQIRKKLQIPATAIANSWRYVPLKNVKTDGAQIDLLFDRRDAVITLCEIKYSHKAFLIDKQYAAQLIKKRDVFVKRTKTKKQLFIAMIAARNIKNNPYSDELISGVVVLDDLFKEV
jgi:uncharacterized protein